MPALTNIVRATGQGGHRGRGVVAVCHALATARQHSTHNGAAEFGGGIIGKWDKIEVGRIVEMKIARRQPCHGEHQKVRAIFSIKVGVVSLKTYRSRRFC